MEKIPKNINETRTESDFVPGILIQFQYNVTFIGYIINFIQKHLVSFNSKHNIDKVLWHGNLSDLIWFFLPFIFERLSVAMIALTNIPIRTAVD